MPHEKTGRVEFGSTLTETGQPAADVDRHGEPVASTKEKFAANADRTQDLMEEHIRQSID